MSYEFLQTYYAFTEFMKNFSIAYSFSGHCLGIFAGSSRDAGTNSCSKGWVHKTKLVSSVHNKHRKNVVYRIHFILGGFCKCIYISHTVRSQLVLAL
jgi:hypothetical protein